MGSPADEWQSRVDEQIHQVSISHSFAMAVHEITQRQWLAVMKSNPSYLYICPDCPVERVSWLDAVEFCNALSRLVGFTPAYALDDSDVAWDQTADGYRLPTEAEWEYACRAGTSTPYSTGRCLSADEANYNGYRPHRGCAEGMWRGQALPVGSFAPNGWGLYDMHGNVSEWCWDRSRPEEAGSAIGPAGDLTEAAAGVSRRLRGGDFDRGSEFCRSACRQSSEPSRRSRFLGFRPVRTLR